MPQQVWATNSLGGFLANTRLSKTIRHAAQPLLRFRQFARVKEAFGANIGDNINFDKVSNISTAGGTLAETSTIPQNNFTILKGTGSVTEYGNSVPFTGKLEKLAEFDPDMLVTVALRNDQGKVLDSAVGDQFLATDSRYVCTATNTGTYSTNGTFTGTSTSNLTGYHVRHLVNQMKKDLVPRYDGEYFMCIASVEALAGLFEDTASAGFVELSKYTPELAKRAFDGEVGSYYKCRFIEEDNVLSNTIGNGSAYGEAMFFGADAVMELITEPEHIRAKIGADYGRDKGLAWYGILGWKLIWTNAIDSEYRAIYVGSA